MIFIVLGFVLRLFLEENSFFLTRIGISFLWIFVAGPFAILTFIELSIGGFIADSIRGNKEFITKEDELVNKSLSSSKIAMFEKEYQQMLEENRTKVYATNQDKGLAYEKLVGKYFEMKSFSVEYRGIELGVKDGGIDLVLFDKKNMEYTLVQCKNYSHENSINHQNIKEFYGNSMIFKNNNPDMKISDYLYVIPDNKVLDKSAKFFIQDKSLNHHIEYKEIPFKKIDNQAGESREASEGISVKVENHTTREINKSNIDLETVTKPLSKKDRAALMKALSE